MAEDNKPKTNYSSNSAKSKDSVPDPDRPVVEKIATGKVQKRSLGSKFKETFAGDDAGSVGQYILFDVIVPKTKDLLFDMVSQGFERLLFGSSTPRSRSSVLAGKTNYRGISTPTNNARPEREVRAASRSSQNFDEIVLPTRGEAEQVLDTLLALIDQYDSATVADLYTSVGISTDHTDLKFGWTDLSEASIRNARGGGYLLELPRAESL